jgi:methionyl-tRNA formyltransferase
VPILGDDTAFDVFNKVTVAAEMTLNRALPGLLAGTAEHHTMDVTRGSYFGGRKAEDGRIDWTRPAHEVHNLIRAVAPPYPGAFCAIAGRHLRVLHSLGVTGKQVGNAAPMLFVEGECLFARCGDDGLVRITALELDGEAIEPATLPARLGGKPNYLT